MKSIKPYCVYFHINPLTKDIFYIGIGLDKRPYEKTNRNKHWVNYVNKNGVQVLITDKYLTSDEAAEKEIFWIAFFGRKDLGKGKLLNMTDGGEGAFGAVRSDEIKARMSIAAKNRKKYIYTEDHKRNISAAMKGKKHTASHKLNNSLSKIESYKINPNMGMRGKSVSEERKKSQSEATKGMGAGRKLPRAQVEKMIKANTGKKRTEEQRSRISAGRRKGIELKKAS